MSRADRAFALLIVAAVITGAVLSVPLLITLFPGDLQRALHGYDEIAAVCVAALYQLGAGLPPLGAVVLALTTASLLLGVVKMTRTLRRTRTVLRAHRSVTMPRRLQAVAGRLRLADATVCFVDPRPYAYCRGYLWPQIWVSTGAVASLRRPELEAVLHHEDYHRRSFDPLRILFGRVLSQLFFALPIIRLLAVRFEFAKELDADRAVVSIQGTTKHLAGALYALGRYELPFVTAEVAVGAWSLSHARVDQLCGSSEEELLPKLSRRAIWLSAVMLSLALLLTFGQAARANLVPATVIDALDPAAANMESHSCPLPMSGILF
ncbi:MAG: M56 family metallopeptidase [Chloroflexota bacterium]|nr:M56 family metallopeptidase [Chloroflexota bacterium]